MHFNSGINRDDFCWIGNTIDEHLNYIRGREKLTIFSQWHTIAGGKTGNTIINYSYSTYGTLITRVGPSFSGVESLAHCDVDDFSIHETKIFPMVEHFVKGSLGWLHPVDGVKQSDSSEARKAVDGTSIGDVYR
jgi:hypothetical protein